MRQGWQRRQGFSTPWGMPSIGHCAVPTVLRVTASAVRRAAAGSVTHWRVEAVGAVGHALLALARIQHAGIAPVQ